MKLVKKRQNNGRKYRFTKTKRKTTHTDKWADSQKQSGEILVIACGALAKEITMLVRANCWTHLKTRYLPAKLHNEPAKILEQLRKNLQNAHNKFSRIFVGYADCGSGGQLDEMLEKFGVQRLPGAHCYEFYSGSKTFEEIVQEEIGSYFLTDFLVKSFEKLIWQGMKIDSHPQLLQIYFGNYRKLVYLAQTKNPELQAQAREFAERLGLKYEYRFTGFGKLEPALSVLSATE